MILGIVCMAWKVSWSGREGDVEKGVFGRGIGGGQVEWQDTGMTLGLFVWPVQVAEREMWRKSYVGWGSVSKRRVRWSLGLLVWSEKQVASLALTVIKTVHLFCICCDCIYFQIIICYICLFSYLNIFNYSSIYSVLV